MTGFALVVGVVAGIFVLSHKRAAPPTSLAPGVETSDLDPTQDEDSERSGAFRLPTGRPPALSCTAAQAIVRQARAGLAVPPPRVEAAELARSASDWLDPHGLWSAADDTPVEPRLLAEGAALLAELEGAGPCGAARAVGAELARWVAELRTLFDASAARADASHAPAAARAAVGSTEGARELARALGDAVGAARTLVHAHAFGDAARARFFPSLSAGEWGDVVLAAAVRAYVPLIDPHGAWAPADEEASVYEVELDAHPAPRLWEHAVRTPIGLSIGTGAVAPLGDGDVVFDVSGLATAGFGVEELDELAFAAADGPRTLTVLRAGGAELVRLEVGTNGPPATAKTEAPGAELARARVPFGLGSVLVLAPRDVRDNLGASVAQAIAQERAAGGLAGVVIDLRGNGGGSTEGAIDTLGTFLPKATLFPMKRRDGTIETDRAPDPPLEERWTGPVATLVDGSTASAAEMIAGALAAYRRGPSIGVRTYGKGCAQEYVEDDAHAGILRLTTLLYALPDGAPVQRVGLTPTINLPGAAPRPTMGDPDEREATLAHAPRTWRGPDVRDRSERVEVAWPATRLVGPCADAYVCAALRAVSGWTSRRTVAARAR